MDHHTFDVDGADRLEDAADRYRYLSREGLIDALDPSATDVVADVGSGTGFYTDDVAPHVGRVYAVDVQPAMHDYYREKGIPANVDLVAAEAADLPFDDDALDALVSTMTFHEFAGEEAIVELARVARPGATVAIVDWTATGAGEDGPPLDERFDATAAEELVADHGFDVTSLARRPETFRLTAIRAEG